MGQAFQASEKHPVGWEGKRLPLAVGWRLQELLHGATVSGWQWMGAMVRQGQPGQVAEADQAHSKSGQRAGATAEASEGYPAKKSNFGCCQKWKTLAQSSSAQGK